MKRIIQHKVMKSTLRSPSGVGLTETQSLGVGAAVLAAGALASTIAWRAGLIVPAVIIGVSTLLGAPLVASRSYGA